MREQKTGQPARDVRAVLKKVWPIGLCVLLIAGMYALIGCPIKYCTGISCPGCGMTRAAWALVQLDFGQAAYYHPLVFALPLYACIWLVRSGPLARPVVRKALLVAAVLSFLVVYVLRMFWGPNEVVSVSTPGFLRDLAKIKGTLEGIS